MKCNSMNAMQWKQCYNLLNMTHALQWMKCVKLNAMNGIHWMLFKESIVMNPIQRFHWDECNVMGWMHCYECSVIHFLSNN